MKIISAKVETIYHIEYTFEEFMAAARCCPYYLDKAFKIDGVDLLDMPEKDQRRAFTKIINGLHGDTYLAIAKHFDFDGWKHAGLYNKAKDVRTLTVYREGDDL